MSVIPPELFGASRLMRVIHISVQVVVEEEEAVDLNCFFLLLPFLDEKSPWKKGGGGGGGGGGE